jgi:hypothetical protein
LKEEKMKLFVTAMMSLTFVLGIGMIGLAFFFGKLALASATRE